MLTDKLELRASQVVLVITNPPANAGDIKHVGLTPGLGKSPEGGHGNSLQYSCLENPMDRGAWWAIFHRVAKSQTQLKQLSIQHIVSTSTEISRGGFGRFYFLASSM